MFFNFTIIITFAWRQNVEISQLLVSRLPLALRREKAKPECFRQARERSAVQFRDHSRSGIICSPGIIAELLFLLGLVCTTPLLGSHDLCSFLAVTHLLVHNLTN